VQENARSLSSVSESLDQNTEYRSQNTGDRFPILNFELLILNCFMSIIYLSLGSNIKPCKEYLAIARNELSQKIKIVKESSLYETEPIGIKDQSWFINQVIKGETDLKPLELLEFTQSIENKLKRTREVKYGPRTIDIDILFYDEIEMDLKKLTLPHPELHKRAFVLVPLLEIEPEFKNKHFPDGLEGFQDEVKDQNIKRLFS